LEEYPECVKAGDVCIVILVPIKPFCCEAFSEFPSLGRFIVRDNRKVVGIGIMKGVKK